MIDALKDSPVALAALPIKAAAILGEPGPGAGPPGLAGFRQSLHLKRVAKLGMPQLVQVHSGSFGCGSKVRPA